MSNSQSSLNTYFVGSLITSAVGAILLLFTDFANWEHYNYYSGIFSAGWVSGEAIPYFIIIMIVACCLFFCTFVSFIGIQSPSTRYPIQINKQTLKYALMASIAAFTIVTVSALIFVAVILSDEPDYWWMGPGFYGSFIGSALTALIMYTIYINYEGEGITTSSEPTPFLETMQTLNWGKILLYIIIGFVIVFLAIFLTSEAFFEILEDMDIID